MAPDPAALRIAFLGDSLTAGFPGTAYLDILEPRLPRHHLYNYGKGGDTIKSLCRRLLKTRLDDPFDIIFLWVGVNDVLVHVSPLYPTIKRLRRQPWAKDKDELEEDYRLLLEHVVPKTRHLFTVSPLFIGEDLSSPWNTRLVEVGEQMRTLSQGYSNITYIDLRDQFVSRLRHKDPAPYTPRNPLQILFDVLKLKRPQETGADSYVRRFHFTIDGVHLNSTGASLVADVFQQKIQAIATTTQHA